ncbi:MAG: hypothetical protein AAGA81_22200 [Acidobacteriota bacterium]
MIRLLPTFALLLAALAPNTLAAQSGARLAFPDSGFSIEPFEAEVPESVHTPLMMFLPSTGGFAANVNVQIQPFEGDLQGYLDISAGQFEDAGIEVLSSKLVSEGVAVLEYTGPLQGNDLHWYARAIQQPGRIFLVTASLLAEQWEELGEKARRCVDSFELTATASDAGE